MLKVGITGGIGSGKSTIAQVFEVLGIPVYYADHETRKLTDENAGIRNAIIREFGSESYLPTGLNRKFIADIVFQNPQKLDRLNAITHPPSIQHSEEWMRQQTTPYAIKEAALLFESGSAGTLDFIIGVSAPEPVRIKRVIDRDQVTAAQVKVRMSRQIEDGLKMKLCDAVIYNNDQRMVIPQVLQLHELLIEKARVHSAKLQG